MSGILNRWTKAVIAADEYLNVREIAEAHRVHLAGANLSGADLSGADLSGADLSMADLSGADLSRADLRLADLSEAILRRAKLSEAILRSADLRGADLRMADLRGANLSEANLSLAECLTAQGDFLRLAGTRHSVLAIDRENVSVGCIRSTLAKWVESYRETGVKEGYTPDQIEEYGMHLNFVERWLILRERQRKGTSTL